MIGLVTPPMIQNISYGTYIFFAVFCVLSFFWSWFLCPETKQKTLEEMDSVFKDHMGEQDAQTREQIRQELMPRPYDERKTSDGAVDEKVVREEMMTEKRDGSQAFVESV